MKWITLLCLGSCCLVAVMVPVHLQAAPDADVTVLIHDDFQSYTLTGTDDDPKSPGDGNAQPWQIDEATPANVMVVQGGSIGGAGGNHQVLRLRFSAEQHGTVLRKFVPQTGGKVVQSFRIRFNRVDIPTDYRINLQGKGGVATYLRLRPAVHEGTQAGFSIIGGSADPKKVTRKAIVRTIRQGNWYQVTVTADMAAATWEAKVQNLDSEDADQHGELKALSFWQKPVDLSFLIVTKVSRNNSSVDFDLDDVFVTATKK